MSTAILPATTFAPARELPRNTVIEDVPQVSLRRAAPQKLQDRANIISPMSDDFPTPKAMPPYLPHQTVPQSPSSSDTTSDDDSLWSRQSSHSDFDELYDISESGESEIDELPIKLSASVKKRANAPRRNRYPSMAIPSPSEWPTIEKLQSATQGVQPVYSKFSPAVLSRLQEQSEASTSSAPSLDGSLTSEDLGASCPPTPDIQRQGEADGWEAPAQLDPHALLLLRQIHPDHAEEQLETVVEVPAKAVMEMTEVLESPPITGRLLSLDTKNLMPPMSVKKENGVSDDADDELSALSIPSPGGFFASLDSSIRRTWDGSEPVPTTGIASAFYGVPFRQEQAPPLPTSTAARFYGVPWRSRPDDAVEHTVPMASPKSQKSPVTARKIAFSPQSVEADVDEIDESYNAVLQETATANIDRTQLWLSAQTDYMKTVCEDDELIASFKDIEDVVPRTPVEPTPAVSDLSPSKKSVRFADTTPEPQTGFHAEPSKRISPIHDGTFWQGWRHQKRSQRARDVFQHRQARAEAEHVRRTSMSSQHVGQLQGKYEINVPDRPAPPRPISSLMQASSEDEKKEVIAQAERERQALEQMQSSAWTLSAYKEVNGGRLLTSPIVSSFKVLNDVKILDLSGQVHCSWAWTVAAEHPDAQVFTTVSSDAEAHVAMSALDGPRNHHVFAAAKPWELPFEDNTFDVISARNLYANLKTTWPKGQAADEWDLTLRECLRVLKRGGYLEFDLLDAELVHPDQASQALGVEFAFNLKTRGYDPSAGKSFLPRLKRAGFGDIKRAWMILPVADVLPKWTDSGKTPSSNSSAATRTISPEGQVDYYEPPVTGSTRDVRAMTGIVGARMWEQWMLKVNTEMGRPDGKCLEGVAKALEEAGKGNAGWKCLVGWARNFMLNCTPTLDTYTRRLNIVHFCARSDVYGDKMLFFSFFKTLVNQEVTVELKNDISIRGTLKSVDQYLNIKLDDISVVEEMKYPHLSSVKNVFIRGSVVRYVHLPAAAVDTPLLEDATRRGEATGPHYTLSRLPFVTLTCQQKHSKQQLRPRRAVERYTNGRHHS
ncbi:hypothetical protein BAUCODRAFT_75741 [Baudoinia panamericana UAMH 10762]|uniref:Sm domain-containing protein n=1 Tax=Baudoinia panamericana (strain UAMH 10762) TaxID=717646 RepID=M2N3H3_BAUPA|nr:uncharacterized protein BAUCODRAFT_75741 [Baudoinia panamericana UAMH 10762]EMC93280.1 hypothetical protein BAUCODRAFT_75741 [Baudoinia panamericana UAMH 10762]